MIPAEPRPAEIFITSADTVVSGQMITLAATLDGQHSPLQDVTWTVRYGTGTATLYGNILTGKKAGTVIVTVISTEDRRVSAVQTITVEPIIIQTEFESDKVNNIGIGETMRFWIDTTEGVILDFEFGLLQNYEWEYLDSYLSYTVFDTVFGRENPVNRTRGLYYLQPDSRYWLEVKLSSSAFSSLDFQINVVFPPNLPEIPFNGSRSVLLDEGYNHFIFTPRLRALYTFTASKSNTWIHTRNASVTLIHGHDGRDSLNHAVDAGSKHFIIVYSASAGELSITHNVAALRFNSNNYLFLQERREVYMIFSPIKDGDYVFYSREHDFEIFDEYDVTINLIRLDEYRVTFSLSAGITYRVRVKVREHVPTFGFGTVRITFGDVKRIMPNAVSVGQGLYMISDVRQFEVFSSHGFTVFDEFLRQRSSEGVRHVVNPAIFGERVFIRFDEESAFVVLLQHSSLTLGEKLTAEQVYSFNTDGLGTYVANGASLRIYNTDMIFIGEFNESDPISLPAGRYLVYSNGVASLNVL